MTPVSFSRSLVFFFGFSLLFRDLSETLGVNLPPELLGSLEILIGHYWVSFLSYFRYAFTLYLCLHHQLWISIAIHMRLDHFIM